jgi:hypothetical protein
MFHPETRKAVQEDIFSWITHGQAEPQPKKILWMSGPAGCGKTAIAGTIAEECEARGLLAGSFFCSSFSWSHERRSKQFVIPTLAYQLIQNNRTGELRGNILSWVEGDPTIFRKRLKDQSRVLLLYPSQTLHNRTPPGSIQQIFIIDGLDEIESSSSRLLDRQGGIRENEGDQVEILFALLQAILHPAFPFRVLIASRPERGIREFFAEQQVKKLTLEVFLDDKYNPDDDIELFLRSKFADIRRRYRLPSSWPADDVIKALVFKASGQFIYATTIVRFLEGGANTPHEQLNYILSLPSAKVTTENPFATLDSLYVHILNSSPNPSLAAEWILSLRMMAEHNNFSSFYCRRLLEHSPGEADHILGNLSSLIYTPTSDDEPYQLYHRSLLEFLHDPRRGRMAFPDISDPPLILYQSFIFVLKSKSISSA